MKNRICSLKNVAPKNEQELKDRCRSIAGLTLAGLASQLGLIIPGEPAKRKGFSGMALELALGATSSNLSLPDFQDLGIELKTIPLSKSGKPAESTFITSIPLLTIHKQKWETSQCFAKLKKILWIPLEGDVDIPYAERRLGQGFIWSPDEIQTDTLCKDWTLLTSMIATGHLESLDARKGEYLQVRPKGADGKSLCYGFDAEGNKIKTLPRGFYLRSCFTAEILKMHV